MGKGYRHNHYVPEWYQSRFLPPGTTQFWYLDLAPDKCTNDRAAWTRRELLHWGPKKCFAQSDLYTTRWASIENTDIERFFFGQIDQDGQRALEYICNFDHRTINETAHRNFLIYLSVQKLRTPKGLAYLRDKSKSKSEALTLIALQHLQAIFCATWTECVWQVADAEKSATKFLLSDHPVTVYNRECFPDSKYCRGHGDPDIRCVGTHTIFPLSLNKILILTNRAWVRDPYQEATKFRPNPELFRPTVFNFSAIQTERQLEEEEVLEINYVIKRRALRYVAAAQRDWLYPEKHLRDDHWRKLGDGYLFMPDPRYEFMGGDIFVGFKGGGSAGYGVYGHRPWQRGFKDERREARERFALEKFKAEFSATFGKRYRGISYDFASPYDPPVREESDESHRYYLEQDSVYREKAGERQRRRSLVRKKPL